MRKKKHGDALAGIFLFTPLLVVMMNQETTARSNARECSENNADLETGVSCV
jgi:hypothetical protein